MSLTAVPAASSQLRQGEEQFRRHVQKTLEAQSGTDATEDIVKMHMSMVGSLFARADASAAEATTMAADARSRYDMLQQAHNNASRQLAYVAEQAAEISALRGLVDHIRHMAERADNGMVPQANILGALVVTPPIPARPATVTAFVTDHHWRSGLFESPDATVTLPFVGYSLVDYGPGAAGIIETTFLMNTRTLPHSAIQTETGMTLTKMLPARHLASA